MAKNFNNRINQPKCSFCGRTADKVTNMIKGPENSSGTDSYICEV